MRKAVLNIFETESEGEKVYRAVMQVGENPQPVSMGKIVYQDGEEVDSFKDTNDAIRRLKEKAENWAREQGIPFVHNIDINPYD